MADRRRRRRVRTSEDSEELSDGSEKDHSLEKESEEEHSELEKPTVESEYESAEEEDGTETDKVGKKKPADQTEMQGPAANEAPAPVLEETVAVVVDDEKRETPVEFEEEKESQIFLEEKEDDFSHEIPEMQEFIEGEISGDLLDGEEGGVEEAADIEAECEFIEDELPEDDDDDDVVEEEDEEEECFEGERQQGDGEESTTPVPPKEKVLDDDEDRRNPQYIPKKGSFYEHDDRLGSEHEEEEEPKEKQDKEKGKKKKLWLDEGRWGHDMFREEEQGPKSTDELVSVYGYDIRNEDNAPRARRRRRYGRGPNKYTRNWQDEDAYFKARLAAGDQPVRGRGRGRGPRSNRFDKQRQEEILENGEEFPALPSKRPQTPPLPPPDRVVAEVESHGGKTERDRSSQEEPTVVKTLTFQNSRLSRQRSHQSDSDSTPPSVGRGRGNRQERRPRRGGRRGRQGDYPGDRRQNDSSLEDAMENMRIEEQQAPTPTGRTQRENKPPPRRDSSHGGAQLSQGPNVESGQKGESNRPKRYSSLRQRSLLENSSCYSSTPANVTGQYFEAGYRGAMYTSDTGASPAPTPAPQVQPGMINPYQGYTQPPYQETFALRAPVATPPRLFTPVTLPTGPAAPPVTYIAPAPPANLMSYAPPPAPPGAVYPQYSFQPYRPSPTGPPPAVVGLGPMPTPQEAASQQAELFRGGITYYNTHNQQHVGRHLPQKRPKAAIPILPPPASEEKDESKMMGISSDGSNPTVEVES